MHIRVYAPARTTVPAVASRVNSILWAFDLNRLKLVGEPNA
jgi:hypothetical protein